MMSKRGRFEWFIGIMWGFAIGYILGYILACI